MPQTHKFAFYEASWTTEQDRGLSVLRPAALKPWRFFVVGEIMIKYPEHPMNPYQIYEIIKKFLHVISTSPEDYERRIKLILEAMDL